MWEAVAASVVVNPPEAEGREVIEGEEAAEEGEEEAREAKTSVTLRAPRLSVLTVPVFWGTIIVRGCQL